jgi:16S rRNA (cytosine1402-N4)-methyltransferase
MAHYSVLLQEAIDGLDVQPEDIVIDGTVNGGGHSAAIAAKLSKKGILIGFDLDEHALDKAKQHFENALPEIHLVHENFRNLDAVIQRLRISAPNKILFDLGWSRNQIDEGGRGFSFQKDEPLLMTYLSKPTESDITAMMILNDWKEETIADILFGYGEEQFARRIARNVVESRSRAPIETTRNFVELIERSVPIWYRKKRIHPATKSFQALRIAVNDELGALSQGIEKGVAALAPKGRIAIISFHSIEDRIVKNMFRDFEQEGKGKVLTKKPIIPSELERNENPASRSAKLRIFEKID